MAQYIVAWALGIDSTQNKSWQSFDLVSPSKNKRIEVKSTAYLHSWGSVSKPLFVLQERRAWSEETGLAEKPEWNADIYVLSFFYWLESESADIMNLNQWKFWVFSKEEIVEKLKGRKSVTASELEKAGYIPLKASELRSVILRK